MSLVLGKRINNQSAKLHSNINNKVFDIDNLNDLEQAIFELENNGDALILSAESDSLHVWVVTVMDLLNKYGFNEVQIRTIEK